MAIALKINNMGSSNINKYSQEQSFLVNFQIVQNKILGYQANCMLLFILFIIITGNSSGCLGTFYVDQSVP